MLWSSCEATLGRLDAVVERLHIACAESSLYVFELGARIRSPHTSSTFVRVYASSSLCGVPVHVCCIQVAIA